MLFSAAQSRYTYYVILMSKDLMELPGKNLLPH